MTIYPHLDEGVLTVDGASVRYYVSRDSTSSAACAGGDDAPPIVLLHGSTGPAEANFWALFPMLAFTRRVITFDFALPPGGEPLRLEHYAAQTQAVIRTCSPGRPVALVGHSLGAVVAAATAAGSPEAVASLVLIAGWLKTDRQQLLRNEVWQTLHDEGSAALASFGLFTAYSQQFLLSRTSRDYAALRAKAAARTTEPRVMALNREIDILDDCLSISAPTLVIGCTFDQMVPLRHSRELFGAISDSRYVEVACGHAAVQERPAELFVLIDRFVDSPRVAEPGTVLVSDPA